MTTVSGGVGAAAARSNTESVLQVSGLVKTFGSLKAVDDVSLQISPGETFGLLGPNGAGKTTTISMIAGLLEPDAGSITIMGEPMVNSSVAAKRHIGLVPQDLAIYPELSARDNLRFFGRLQGLRGARLNERVDTVLNLIGLSDRAKEASKKLFAQSTRGASLTLPATKKGRKGKEKEEQTLPDDMHFSSRQLITLFLKPKFAVRFPKSLLDLIFKSGAS